MSLSASSRRRLSIVLIWSGGLMLALTGAFTLAWVKLPAWKPDWVIKHSPWMDPTVRALMAYDVRDHGYLAQKRIMDWGSAIGPLLRQYYEAGSIDVREQVLDLANATLDFQDAALISVHGAGVGYDIRWDSPGIQRFSPRRDGRRLIQEEEQALLADLRWLAIAASKESSADLRARMLPLIAVVRDPDLMQLPCDWLLSGSSGIDDDRLIWAIFAIRDPRSVTKLLPLLPTREQPDRFFNRTMITLALRACLAPSQVAVVVGASRHQAREVREWAASVIDVVRADPELAGCLSKLLSDPEAPVRLMALHTVIRQGLPDAFHEALIALLGDQTEEIRRTALDAVIAHDVPLTLRAAFLARLEDPVVDLRRMTIDTIGKLRIRDGGAPLHARLTVESELPLRLSIIESLERLEHINLKPVLRQIAVLPTDPLQGAAIVALGTRRDPTDFSLLLSLLSNDDDDIARKARIALGYLPLTSEQQKQVDALWEAELDDEPALAPLP